MDGTLAIDYRPIGDLIPYARNARTHSEAQVALIAGSIREYGFTNPVLVDGENGIIAGHGRVMAARKLGLAQVPVIELAHLTEAQKRAYIIADNKLAEQAGWDRELLALELGDLQDMAVDLLSLGFDAAELDALLRSGAADEREDIPPVPAVSVSQPGDLWILGNHRLICGDATDAATVAKVLNGVRPHLLVSDPPYGVEYDPAWRNEVGATKTKRVGKVLNDHRADWHEAWALFPGDVAYVWHGALHSTTVAESLIACGFAIPQPDHLGQGAAGTLPRRRPLAARALLVCGPAEGDGTLVGRPQADHALEHPEPRPGRRHGAWHAEAGGMHAPPDAQQLQPQPGGVRAVLGFGVLHHCRRDLRAAVPCRGTGPGLRRCGRRAWQAFTGREAVLEATGETFATVRAARCPEEVA